MSSVNEEMPQGEKVEDIAENASHNGLCNITHILIPKEMERKFCDKCSQCKQLFKDGTFSMPSDGCDKQLNEIYNKII